MHGDDTRGGRGHLVRHVDDLVHHTEDRGTSLLGLAQRPGQHVGGDAVELGVQLQGGDELAGAGHLEVHVTQGVLGAEDVGEGQVLGLAVLVGLAHESHGDTGHRGTQRHTGVEQGQGGGTHRTHRGGAIGTDGLRDLTDCVGELLTGGQHRDEGTLGEVSVTHLAALRGADAARLTGGVRRHVVVVHVAPGGLRREGVELLLHVEHVERADAQNLGLTTLEQGRSVHPWDDSGVGGQGTDVTGAATVDAHPFVKDALAHDLLHEGLEGTGDLVLTLGELLGQLGLDASLEGGLGVLAFQLGSNLLDACQLVGTELLDGSVDVVLVVLEDREVVGLLGQLGCQGQLGIAEHLDERLGGLQAGGDDLLGGGGTSAAHQVPGGRGGLGLDHHDGDVTVGQHAPGDHHVEGGLLALLDGGEADPLVADEGHAHATDRAGERQTGDLGGHRRGIDGDDVVVDLGVEGQDGDDDLHLVAQPLDERRANRSVDETAGQDGVLRWASLPAEERAGNAPGGVHALLDVNRQREEVDGVAWGLGSRRRGQQHGVAVQVDGSRTIGLLSEQTGFETDDVLAESTVVDDCLGELETGSLHGVFLSGGDETATLRRLVHRPALAPVFDRSHRGLSPVTTTEDRDVRPAGERSMGGVHVHTCCDSSLRYRA